MLQKMVHIWFKKFKTEDLHCWSKNTALLFF